MRHIFFRILAGLLLLAAIVGIAVITYNAGVAHGQAISAQAPAVQNGVPAYPAYWWPFPWFGFGFLALLALFFLFSIASAALRFMLWGPRFGWHRWPHRYGYWGKPGDREDIPPMFSELHRRMHAAEGEKPAGQTTQKFD